MLGRSRTPVLPEPRPVTPGLLEAQQAQRDATDGLMGVIERGPEVRATRDRVDNHADRNHFLEMWDQTMGRRRHG